MPSFGVFDAARTAVRMIGRAAKVHAYEVALMASVATMAPLHLVGGGLDPSYGPRSPVQAHTAPTTRPVLLVHGLGGTKSSWALLAQALSARGLTVEAVTYTPFGTSVEQLADSSSRWTGCYLEPARTRYIWSDTAWVGSSSRRPSRAVALTGWSTPSSPWGHLSEVHLSLIHI